MKPKRAGEHRKRWAWRNLVQIYLRIPPHASFRPNITDIYRKKCLTSGNSSCN